MTRNFRYLLTLTALAATLALHGSVMAGHGISFGGGGGNFSGAMRSSMGSHAGRSPVNSPMQFKSQGNFAKGPQLGNITAINRNHGQVLKQNLSPMSRPQNISKMPGHHQLGQVVNKNFPNVNANLLQGNVRNNLLGNASGANPKLGINLGGQSVGGRGSVGSLVGGQIAGGINKHVGVQVGGGGVPGKFCATPVKGKADCRHVIDMLVRHCVGNQVYDPCIKHHCPDPAWVNVGWIPAPVPVAPIAVGAPLPGDLELVEVCMLSDATPEQGPVYQVTVRNVGTIDAEQFRVSIVAVLGEIAEDSPSVTINVDRIAAGETATLQIQMPVTVMALGPQGQAPAPFDTMVVAIDSFDELQESNELNNVATLKRTEVVLIGAATATAVEAAPAPTAPAAAPAPVDGTAPAAEAPAGGAPDANAAPSEDGDINIDNLELDDADEATELFTR